MRALVAICAATWVAGCAGGGVQLAPTVPEQPESDVAAISDLEVECGRAEQLARSGEHKPAVDALSALGESAACSREALDAVAESRRTLHEADALVRLGLEAREAGDLAAAKAGFERALAVYPRYYWVEQLVRALEPATAELERLRQQTATLVESGRADEALRVLEQARQYSPAEWGLDGEIAQLRSELAESRLALAYRAQQEGRLAEAIELTERAMGARPDPPAKDRVVEFARLLGLELFSDGQLVRARDIWQRALAWDEDNEQLRKYLVEVEARLESLDEIKETGGELACGSG